jgi:uncharacterized membrane protein YdjX (TVP38/TMEM64 family)
MHGPGWLPAFPEVKLNSNQGKSPGRKIKWLKEGLLLLGVLLLSASIALILVHLQSYLKVNLQNYALLAYCIVFAVSLLSSATIFIPAPGIAIVLAAATQWDPFWVAIAAGTGDALGEITAYWAGYVGERIIVDEHMAAYQKVMQWMQRYGAWAVFGIALVPILPFDLVGIVAGGLKLPRWKFIVATWCGKVPRVFLIVYLSHQLPLWLHPWLYKAGQ